MCWGPPTVPPLKGRQRRLLPHGTDLASRGNPLDLHKGQTLVFVTCFNFCFTQF